MSSSEYKPLGPNDLPGGFRRYDEALRRDLAPVPGEECALPPLGPVPDLYPYVETTIVTDAYRVGPISSVHEELEGVLVANGDLVYVDGRLVGHVTGIRVVPTQGGRVEHRISVRGS